MVSRYARKVDGNHSDTVDALRKIGCSVIDLSRVGGGCPDLMVGYRGCTILMEVKNVRGRNKIEDSQRDWIATWRGDPVHVVRSPEQAVEVAGSYGK